MCNNQIIETERQRRKMHPRSLYGIPLPEDGDRAGFFRCEDAMLFTIGKQIYFAVVAPGRIIRDRVPCLAYCQFCEGLILIDPTIAPERRRELLFHELRHAWTNEFPVRRYGIEERGRRNPQEWDADSVGKFIDHILPQYTAQGGDDRLLAMRQARVDPNSRHIRRLEFNCAVDFDAPPVGEMGIR